MDCNVKNSIFTSHFFLQSCFYRTIRTVRRKNEGNFLFCQNYGSRALGLRLLQKLDGSHLKNTSAASKIRDAFLQMNHFAPFLVKAIKFSGTMSFFSDHRRHRNVMRASVICDPLQNKWTAKWNLFITESRKVRRLIKH